MTNKQFSPLAAPPTTTTIPSLFRNIELFEVGWCFLQKEKRKKKTFQQRIESKWFISNLYVVHVYLYNMYNRVLNNFPVTLFWMQQTFRKTHTQPLYKHILINDVDSILLLYNFFLCFVFHSYFSIFLRFHICLVRFPKQKEETLQMVFLPNGKRKDMYAYNG